MGNCILCGAELVEGKCPNAELHLKKMCLNCTFMDEGVCRNEDNMNAVLEKVKASIQMPGGYELDALTVKPVKLKDPTKKCGRYTLNTSSVLLEITELAK